jgi:alpha-tubulin suppressor-like RCC1 family protein
VQAVSAGYNFSVALRADGTVWACGANANGQIGDGTTTQRTSFVQVGGLTGVTAISAGYQFCLALKSDGSVWAWGYNGYGQLGDGTTTQRNSPVQVVGLSGIVSIAAGGQHSGSRLRRLGLGVGVQRLWPTRVVRRKQFNARPCRND